MFFYRHPGWGIGFKILIIVLLIAGGTFIARSSFQESFLQGAAVEGNEKLERLNVPTFHLSRCSTLTLTYKRSFLTT